MRSDGTVAARRFLSLPAENDSLNHAMGRIKKAQRHGARKTPGLWAFAKGINDRIAVRTAQFIVDTAILYSADVIVMEHLDTQGKKRGSKKQRLHLWKSQYVQAMVTQKAHRSGIRISRVCAWNTSRHASLMTVPGRYCAAKNPIVPQTTIVSVSSAQGKSTTVI